MNKKPIFQSHQWPIILVTGWLVILLSGCGSPTPDMSNLDYEPFVPPTLEPTKKPTPTPEVIEPTPKPVQGMEVASSSGCTDNLVYVADATIPDGTVVVAGSTLDKQWQVRNNGSCAWGQGYTFEIYDGQSLGAPAEQALPATEAGAEATIRMLLTAPTAPGEYMSAWQAVNPDGTPFGDPIYIDFIVQ